MGVDPAKVWDRIADLADHPTWMADAQWVLITSPATRGVGASMVVRTRVGPFRTTDLIEVTGWVDGHSIEVDHKGLVSGAGSLIVTAEGGGSRVTWRERLVFPWWLGGRITAWAARPVLRRVWAGNLDRLAALVEPPA